MKEFYPEGIRKKDKAGYSLSRLYEALSSKEVLEATALLCDANHDLTVHLGCMKGIIKREEGAIGIKDGTTRDIALISRVGKSVAFTVKEIIDNEDEQIAILSRREAQEKYLEYFRENVKMGDIFPARVTHIESFGVFCDIGCGAVALLPIDCISVSRINNPADRFFAGQDIKVALKSVAEDGKITVTFKELLGTWEENAALFEPHQTVSGVVRSVEDYGVFVELSPNLAGLAEPTDVKAGDSVSVYIKSIIPEKMKVKLIIIDTLNEKYTPEIKYFYNGEHIDRFDYSPEKSKKRIFTDFSV